MTKKANIPQYDAAKYAEFRPNYPQALYDRIFAHVQQFDLAWDCACGTGQAAVVLAERFQHVLATDISDTQIAQAQTHARIEYQVSPSEKTPLADHSVDLVSVAQALHWFATPDFFKEVTRVLKPVGLLAAWGYGPPKLSSEIDAITHRFAYDILGDYWAPGREYLDRAYEDILFPYERHVSNDLFCEKPFTLQAHIGLFESWSPRLKYLQVHGKDPIALVAEDLKKAWGSTERRMARFQIYLLMGSPVSQA